MKCCVIDLFADSVIQKRLLAEGDDLTLDKALTLAQALESAVQDAQDLRGLSHDTSKRIFKFTHQPEGPSKGWNQAQNGY